MKYLLISGIYPPEIGGPANFIPKIAEFLICSGHEVSIVTLTNEQNRIRFDENQRISFITRRQNLVLRIFHTCRVIRKEGKIADRILINGLYPESSVALIGINKPKVAKIVGDPVWERFRNKTGNMKKIEDFNESKLSPRYRAQRFLLNWSLGRVSAVTTPGYEIANLVENWKCTSEIFVIANGVACKQPKSKRIFDFEYDIISVSRLVSWKNINVLIEANAKLGTRLLVIGDGPELESLRKLARKLNSNCRFLGEVKQEEISDFMDKSYIYSLLSSYEGLSFSLLEAAMNSMTLLVSNINPNLEVVTHNKTGKVADVLSVESTCKGVSELLENRDFGLQLGIAANLFARQSFCQEKQFKKILESFNQK